jgi:hypothetical protein
VVVFFVLKAVVDLVAVLEGVKGVVVYFVLEVVVDLVAVLKGAKGASWDQQIEV